MEGTERMGSMEGEQKQETTIVMKRSRNFLKYWWVILVAVVVVGLAGVWSSVRFFRSFAEEQTQGRQVPSTQLQVAAQELTASEVTYDLLEGWNFVAFPLKPINFGTAAELVVDVARKGGYVTTVAYWDGDRWQEFSQRGVEAFGLDFPIKPQVAYFLRAEKSSSWRVVGVPLTDADLTAYTLQPGWNGVGLPAFRSGEGRARDVLDRINIGGGSTSEKVNEIDWWQGGSWDVFVKRLYSSENIQEYGNNFPIMDSRGYMIKANQTVEWKP